MILVDTNVIIDFWDKPTEEVKNILEEMILLFVAS